MNRSSYTIFCAFVTLTLLAGWKLFDRYYDLIQKLDYIF